MSGSEAAKPADPERALARLEQLERHGGDALHDGMLRDVTAGDLAMLLPLARAGLDAERIAAERDAYRAEVQRAHGHAWSPGVEAAVRVSGRICAGRDALRAEFTACVRALFAAVHCEVGRQGEKPYPALCASHRAEAQIALSGPLAAAVLRSPEPATPADGGA